MTLGVCNKLAISWPPQHYKPVYNGSMVLTSTGQRKPIGELLIGDSVITHMGRPRRVLGVHDQGVLPCVRIRTELGRETVAATTHPFLTPDGWVLAGDLRPGVALACVPKPQIEASQSDRSNEEFRLAGYFVGDGTTTSASRRSSCHATITCVEAPLGADIERCAAACGFGIKPVKPQKGKAAGYQLSGGVRDWLRECGLAGCNSKTKRVPHWVFTGNQDQIANFVGAYFDCDGHVAGRGMSRNGGVRKDPCIEFLSVNRPLLADVQHLLLRLGVRARLAVKNGTYKGLPHVSYRLAITSQHDAAVFAQTIPVRGQRAERIRRAELIRTRFGSQFIEDRVVSVEDAGPLPCRCLTVEEDHTFTSDDLVVHNTWSTTVRYPLWRMLRTPGLRVGVGTYNQRYANKVSRWTRRLAERVGLSPSGAVDSWELPNGSTYIARGAGVGLSGEPVDLWCCDDPFKNRESADSPVVQEKVWEWHMDDVTPRIQQGGAYILIHTRWSPGDLIGRIQAGEDAANWRYVRLPAVAETQEERDAVNGRQGLPVGGADPLGRAPGAPLCPGAFDAESLASKRVTLGVGFESLYQQNPVPRGGSFFDRSWFAVVPEPPEGCAWERYWDLAASRADSACYTSGVLMGRHGSGAASRYYVGDVVRGRWEPATRNEIMLRTARADAARVGFRRTWFEKPVFDKDGSASRAVVAALAGFPVSPDNVSRSGSKEIRAEPLAGAAKAGLVALVAGSWTAAYLTEIEAFPRGQFKDQVDSSSGCFNKLSRPAGGWSLGGEGGSLYGG